MVKRAKCKKTARKKQAAKPTPELQSIRVLVPRTDRLVAINALAQTVSKLADALCQVPIVHITGCRVTSSGIGINIGFEDKPLEELGGRRNG